MEIEYSSKKLKKKLETEVLMKKEFNTVLIDKIKLALFELKAANNMQDIVLMCKYNVHWLEGKRKSQIALKLTGLERLIVEPVEITTREFLQIDKIIIIDVENYH